MGEEGAPRIFSFTSGTSLARPPSGVFVLGVEDLAPEKRSLLLGVEGQGPPRTSLRPWGGYALIAIPSTAA
jgi:hypothetical protein